MIDLDNQTDFSFELSKLEQIADALSSKEVELLIVDNETIEALNTEHRGKTATTDVLSFPVDAPFTEQSIFGMPLGSIIVAASLVKAKAAEFGHSEQDELSLLFIHGMLHLLGFDHETDEGEMRVRENELITQFALPKSLIVRTEEN